MTKAIRFMEQTKNVQIRLRAFERLKPWFIKRLKEFNSCCWNYDVQMAKIKNEFNVMCIRFFHQYCSYNCNTCRPHGEAIMPCTSNNNIVKGVRNMCEHIFVPQGRGHMSFTNQNVSRAIVLAMAFQHSNFALMKLIQY